MCVSIMCFTRLLYNNLQRTHLKKKIHVTKLYKIIGRFQDFSGPVETLIINRQRLLVSRVTGRFSEERTGLK